MPHQALVFAAVTAAATLLGGVFAGSQAVAPPIRLADAEAAPAPNPAGLACEIRESLEGRTRTLEAIVRGAERAAGDYRFAVTSRGSGGSSRSAQNGTFELKPRDRDGAVLGRIGLDAGADYEARLTLTLPDDEVVCVAED